MKNTIFIALLLISNLATAATITSNQTGNWNTVSTWVGGVVPTAADDVVIASTHTVTLSDARACTALSVVGTLTITSTGSLSQSGTSSVAGTLNLNSGTLDFSQVIAVAGVINFNSGTYTFNGGGFGGTGTVNAAGGTVNFNAGSSLTDNLTVSGGTFQGNLAISLQNLTISGGTFKPSGTATIGGNLSISSGTFDPGGNATVAGTLAWSSGSIGNGAGTASTVDVAGNSTISNALSKTLIKKTLNLNGGADWTAGSIFTSGGPVLNVPAGQALTFNSASNASLGSSGIGTVNLSGTLNKEGSGTLTVGAALNNTGTIYLQQGTLDVNGAFTQNGTVKGISTMDVASISFANNGSFSPGSSPGMLTVAGNFSNNGGSLDIEIGGTTVGTEYDRLVVSGAATLNGTGDINITLVNGYVPQVGHSFTILDAVSLSGIFASPSGPFVLGGANWSISYDNAQGTITLMVQSILPVELTELNAQPSGNAAMLTWHTASELNNMGFLVEKSLDGVDFQELAFIDGNGDCPIGCHYSYKDEAFMVSAYYRLVQMDFNGDKSVSPIVFLEKEQEGINLNIYPNPARYELTLQFPEKTNEPFSIVIIDSFGKKHLAGMLNSQEYDNNKTISLHALPTGLYYLIIHINNEKMVRQFVKY